LNLHDIADFFLHLDVHLESLMRDYQTTTYFILCLIIFCETGLIATPFLPGDSLLFAAGAITFKTGILNIWILIPLLFIAAILGDNVNYFVGNKLGTKLFDMKGLNKILKREYLTRTEHFYEKHGGQTIIIARFIPIIRTFAPFVAGLGNMKYSKYISYCIVGGMLWVTLLTLAGYYFGQIPIVRDNFEIVILGIIFISLVPAVIQIMKIKQDQKKVS
jgi:membrane-associated protein